MSDNPYQATKVTDDLSDASDPHLDRTVSILRQTKPWVRFFSVLTFIASAFVVLGGLAIGASMVGGSTGVLEVVLGVVVFMLLAPTYIITAVFLKRYADRIESFVQERSTGTLAFALEAQKSYWKFSGIITLVIVAIAVVGVVAAILIPWLAKV